MTRRIVVALVFACLLAAPATAPAAVPSGSCAAPALACAPARVALGHAISRHSAVSVRRVEVPLDRSGAVPGTISLHVDVLRPSGPSRGVMFLLAGGPGQGSARTFDLGSSLSASFLQYFLPDYTLVAFDNRGTGDSAVLRCPKLQAATIVTAEEGALLAEDCANSIGTQRRFYATRDHAEDIESVRRALGFGKIGVFGVSYGTKLALAYALAHPDVVDRLLLDSVLPAGTADPFQAATLRALPGALDAFCGAGRCRNSTPGFAADVVALANQLETAPIEGAVLRPDGRVRQMRLTGEDLLGAVISADLSPGLAAELPAAVHAARVGYTRPLLRLFALSADMSFGSVEDLSFGLYAATTCADGGFPWDVATELEARPALLDAATAALPPGSLGPFGNWAARMGTASFCLRWPSAPAVPLGVGPLPNVPVLALSGGFDLRTPTAGAQAVVGLFPQGRLLVVPGIGHSVLTSDYTLCSHRAVRSWLAGGPVRATCPRVPELTPVLGPFPRIAKPTPPATFALALATLREAEATALQGGAAGGLYGGRLVPTATGSGFKLVGYSIVPGVAVTGKVDLLFGRFPLELSADVRITGSKAARGTIRLLGHRARGTLGGRRVSGRF